jgi:hypothetical protein
MDEVMDGRIPPDVVDVMACSIDFWLPPGSDEKRELHRALEAYERAREFTCVEPDVRAQVSDFFVHCLPPECDRLLTPAQRRAIERCAQGEPYRVCDD